MQYVRAELEVPYIVVALLPEDTDGLTPGHATVPSDALDTGDN